MDEETSWVVISRGGFWSRRLVVELLGEVFLGNKMSSVVVGDHDGAFRRCRWPSWCLPSWLMTVSHELIEESSALGAWPRGLVGSSVVVKDHYGIFKRCWWPLWLFLASSSCSK